ncbi:Swi3p KNAG_0C02350 [Huiozyma naganishii CBS 8797]|uniref:SWIRM domain-containing protein n=1 Tax=Huiozyma naganishii (strain ATCC MYA-139 / BCRC 22969 / CBS 8797 / KCTC 17520 / NBRC 10181 / NCYC 3082 / Yp74L-3) TaxID=1071383 RepID=J7S5S3_HUIN7|nr:hypothetical protein KNAG_0C02350 [Kazachstania naganishii CBS 8797]CCK69346.1 hypothetical protein KNAG_0C02350 [Kazachstania naganishii CBS 8797]
MDLEDAGVMQLGSGESGGPGNGDPGTQESTGPLIGGDQSATPQGDSPMDMDEPETRDGQEAQTGLPENLTTQQEEPTTQQEEQTEEPTTLQEEQTGLANDPTTQQTEQTEEPVINQDGPVVDQDGPVIDQEESATLQDQPIIGQDEPATLQDESATLQDGPQFSQDEPHSNQDGLPTDQNEPTTLENGPTTLENGHPMDQDGPGAMQDGPANVQDEPATMQDEPANLQDEPVTMQDEPATLQDAPPTPREETEEPATENGGPQESRNGIEQDEELCVPQSHEIVIPNYASWFHLTKIHQIERKSLPEFFTNRIASKTPEIYVKYRNFMVNSYRLNPNEYFSVTAARRNVSGDAAVLFRVHKFLMKWGLINYQVDAKVLPKNIEPPLTGEYATKHDAPRGYFPFESYKPSVQLPDMSKLKKMMDVDNPRSTLHKYLKEEERKYGAQPTAKSTEPSPSVEAETDQTTSTSLKRELSNDEETGISDRAPKKPKILQSTDEDDWTKNEVISLLQAIQTNGPDWYQIAKTVGTRTPEHCILKFLQLPIEDKFLFQDSGASATGMGPLKYAPHLPFSKSDNPVLSTIAFLVGMVDPKVVQAMTNRGLKALHATKEGDTPGIEGQTKLDNDSKTKTDDDSKVEANEDSKVVTNEDSKVKDDDYNKVEADDDNKVEADIVDKAKEEPTVDTSSKSPAKEATEIALATLGVRSKVFATNEERQLNKLANKLVQIQSHKVNLKLATFDKLEKALELEKKLLQRKQEEFLIQRLSFAKSAHQILEKFSKTTDAVQDEAQRQKLSAHVEQARILLAQPMSLSIGSASQSAAATGSTVGDDNEAETTNEGKSESDIKPISLEAPHFYRYWSG